MAFAAGQRMTAQLLNETFRTPSNNVQVTLGTTTSTTYTATLTTGTACSTTFTAPASGKVEIKNILESFNSGAGFTKCTIEVRLGAVVGSGTVFLAASDDEAHGSTGAASTSGRYGVSTFLTGLTPNTVYNVRQMFRVQSGTGSFLRKRLLVVPTV